MKHTIEQEKGKEYETITVIAGDFDEDSEMSNIVVGVYSNGRGYVSCRTKDGFPISIPIPFKEQGVWKYVDLEGMAQTE